MSLQRINGTGNVGRGALAPFTASVPFVSVSGSAEEAVTATLQYSSWEPFLVRVNFRMCGDRSVDWVLSRDLLREGLATAAGIGDIRFFPGDDGLLLELRSHQGRAFLYGEIPPLRAFVERVFAMVPEGAESTFYSLDAELELLLGSTYDPDRYPTDRS